MTCETAQTRRELWRSPPGWWSQTCSWAAGSTFHTGGSVAECDALSLSPAAGSRWRRNDCSCCSAETEEDSADEWLCFFHHCIAAVFLFYFFYCSVQVKIWSNRMSNVQAPQLSFGGRSPVCSWCSAQAHCSRPGWSYTLSGNAWGSGAQPLGLPASTGAVWSGPPWSSWSGPPPAFYGSDFHSLMEVREGMSLGFESI